MSQLEKQDSSNSYLLGLLGKRIKKNEKVVNYITDRNDSLQEEIMDGKYQIKIQQYTKRESSATKGSRSQHIDTNHTKKRFEYQLKNTEQQLKQLNNQKNPQKTTVTEQQRIAFLKKLENQRKELQKKKQEYIKQQEQKKKKQDLKNQQKREKQESERKEKKKKQLEERIKQMQIQRLQKQEEFKSNNKLLKQKLRQKSLVQKMEQKYNYMQNLSLEQRKKKLAQIRAFHKPIDKKQLQQHAEKLNALKIERANSLAAKLQQQQKKSMPNFYKSVFYKRIKEEIKESQIDREGQDLQKLKEVRDKLKKYSENVRINYKPSIDEKKVQQLKFKNVSHNRSLHQMKNIDQPKKIGLRYLQFSKSKIDTQKLLGAGNKTTQQELKQQQPKKKGYLEDRRKNGRSKQTVQNFLQSLERNNVSKDEKAKKILQFSQNLQKKAKQREELDKLKNGVIDDQLDQLYLKAIEAKLSLLDV